MLPCLPLRLRSKMQQICFLLPVIFTIQPAIGQIKTEQGTTYIIRQSGPITENKPIITSAELTKKWLPLLQGKKTGLVVNPTSLIGKTHLVDTLRNSGIQIARIFAPEHGFRGEAANGQKVVGGIDEASGLPVVSLYGKHYKPTAEEVKGIDIMIFDIQDVGARFYTYISTLHYIMEICSEENIPLLVLDRPNPNGYYVDGPVLNTAYRSFVGIHPIPMVHGMTVGELARMINGKRWLSNGDTCKLTVIPMQNYHHNKRYNLPVNPSPNLGSMEAIRLYPSLGMFEGTVMSMGRGTPHPFELIGAPWLKSGTYTFTPVDIPGKAINPPFKGTVCKGIILKDFAAGFLENSGQIYLDWLILSYRDCPDKATFFNPFFDKLAGGPALREMIIAGKSADEIRSSWTGDILRFLKEREPYMLYDWDPGARLID
jgi:uncharacterized protein YbbC (DUF1343 family)